MMVYRTLSAVLLSTVLAAGCGGGAGGGGDSSPPPAAAPTAAEISGVAATGAPMAGAVITVYDRDGKAVATATADAAGSYRLQIPLTTPAPLVVEASRDDTTLVSTFAETKTTHLNVTPLTNLMAAMLAPDGDPRSLRANAGSVTTASLQEALQDILTVIKPLLETVGDTVNPLTGTFNANGSGHDRVLDVLNITIRPTGSFSNIEVAVRSSSPDLVTSFTSNDRTPHPLPPVPAESLPPVGVADLVHDMVARLTACYALPLEQRVAGATGSSSEVTGGPADVVATACRSLFVGDDPASFLNNGSRVGRDANNQGAFNSLFRRGATGVVFDNGHLEFLRGNAEHDLVFSYRARDTAGNVSNDTLVARNAGGVLKLVGNQYVYNARVRAWLADREFLNQPAADYLSTGYNVWIANQVEAGSPIFDKVLVTAPNGEVITYRPQAGRSELSAVKGDGTLSNSSVVTLAAKFKQASAGSPADYDTGTDFASPAYTDEQIKAIPEQGVWRMEFFHVDSSRPNVVQSYRTISRAATLAEAALVPLPQLTADAAAELRAASATYGVMVFGPPSASSPNVADLSTAGGGNFWTVPEGATSPTTISVYGRAPDPDGTGPLRGANFDDRVNVSSSARKALIQCSTLSVADVHCDSSTGVAQYAQGSTISTIELWALAARGMEISKLPALYYLLPR